MKSEEARYLSVKDFYIGKGRASAIIKTFVRYSDVQYY